MAETIKTNLVGKEVIFSEFSTLPFVGLRAEIVTVRFNEETKLTDFDTVLRVRPVDKVNWHLNGEFVPFVKPEDVQFCS